MSELRLAPHTGGWVHADWGEGHCWVRFTADGDGKLKLTELHSTDPDQIRSIPVNTIRAALATRGAGPIAFDIAMGINTPVDLATLGTRPEGGYEMVRRHTIKRPTRKTLPDSFFAEVASAYNACVVLGLPPNKTISGDAGVSVSTVAKWVGEARRRGHLPADAYGRGRKSDKGDGTDG